MNETRTVCQLHGGAVRNDRDEFVCCKQEEFTAFPQDPPTRQPSPPPDGLREQVAAALHRDQS